MEELSTLKDKSTKKLKEWKRFAEELNVQLHLGAKEAKDKFEEQKKSLGQWLDSIEGKIDGAVDISKEKASDLRSSIDKLRLQAVLGKAESEDYLKDQQKKIAEGLQDIKQKLTDVYDTTKEETSSMIEEISEQLEDFNTRFDLFRLQVHLGRVEVKEEWEEKKKELSSKLNQWKSKLERAEDTVEDKWKGFSEEMTEAWSHFKKAFTN